MGITRSPEQEKAYHERGALAQLNRIMRRPPPPPPPAERRLNRSQVCKILGVGRTTLWLMVKDGRCPPPAKGATCPAGMDPEHWRRQQGRWPASLIHGVAAGLFPVPMEPEEWLALMHDRMHFY